jgi:hypothetical protein
MDWYVVEFLYPQAFERFQDKMFPNLGIISLSILEGYDTKKLFGFFDREGIYLNIEMYNPHQWAYSISLHCGVVFGPTQESKKTRDETECDGFLECFKILQSKIGGIL